MLPPIALMTTNGTTAMPKAPQPGETSFLVLYQFHVEQASKYERQANAVSESVQLRLRRSNPNADITWIEKEASNNHYFKAAVSKQQFHTREAIKYGMGMLTEALGLRIGGVPSQG